MVKKNISYSFIFPNYNSLSGSNSDTISSDGADQIGEVRALCNACPERVITYDQLSSNEPRALYASKWSDSKRAEIKQYVDHWKSLPKYFDLRNYWDLNPCQEGGMSLMVSHSPEVGNTSTIWTKFSSTYNGITKTVYCSLMVSSGDFFYGWTLPDEALIKSKLRDKIVSSRFHENWYCSSNDKSNHWRLTGAWKLIYDNSPSDYPSNYRAQTISNPNAGSEKHVFVPHWFTVPGLQFGEHRYIYGYSYYVDNDGNTYKNSDIYYKYEDGTVRQYSDTNPIVPDNSNAVYSSGTFIINGTTVNDLRVQTIETLSNGCGYYTKDTNIPLTRYKIYYSNNITDNQITLQDNTIVSVDRVIAVEEYRELNEDLKKDFINLEATRRVLYYNSDTTLRYQDGVKTISKISDIPILLDKVIIDTSRFPNPTASNISNGTFNLAVANNIINSNNLSINGDDIGKTGKMTKLSFEPPQEYIDKPPLQIPYNLLRYSLNDRPPFTDCETVLVMWVADSDPANVADGDIQALHNLNWQQYAIPISARCNIKNTYNEYCHNRFLVSYPFRQADPLNKTSYRYHIRCCELYNKNIFREVLYIKDFVEYSHDYILSFQLRSHISDSSIFDIQKFLFKQSNCSALYIRKKYVYISETLKPLSYNLQQQAYYILVPNNLYAVNTNKTYYITDASDVTGNSPFIPTNAPANRSSSEKYFRRKNFDRWDFTDDNDWGATDDTCAVSDNWYISLFDVSSLNVSRVSGVISIANSSGLRSFLKNKISSYSWDDLYISSFGISPCNQFEDESFINHSVSSSDGKSYPLGLLNGYIRIGSIVYGTSTGKVIVGFDKLFDYEYEDLGHFRYNSDTNEYESVKVTYNYGTNEYITTKTNYSCTAFVMNYTG